MTNRVLFTLAGLLLGATFPATGRAQAAAEYGLTAGAAAAAADKVSSAVNEAVKQTGDQLQQRTPGTAPTGASGAATSPTGAPATAAPATTTPAVAATPAPVATKTLAAVMKENQEKLRPKAEQTGATLRIDSTPARATVLIDGWIVGATPVELKLASAQHIIELKQADSHAWRKEVSLKPEESVSLRPVLQYKYPSVVTLSAN